MNLDTISVPAPLFWSFLAGAFSLFGYVIRQSLKTRELRVFVKTTAAELPKIVSGLADERGVESILPPPDRPRKKLTTLNGVESIRACIREGHRILDTKVRATNLPSERPFARLQATDETPQEPAVQRARLRENDVPHLGFEEDRDAGPPESTPVPKRR